MCAFPCLRNFVSTFGILICSAASIYYSFDLHIFHTLGLLDSVLAVPWLIQIGFVQALPLLLELSIEIGIVEGIDNFLSLLHYLTFLFTRNFAFLSKADTWPFFLCVSRKDEVLLFWSGLIQWQRRLYGTHFRKRGI